MQPPKLTENRNPRSHNDARGVDDTFKVQRFAFKTSPIPFLPYCPYNCEERRHMTLPLECSGDIHHESKRAITDLGMSQRRSKLQRKAFQTASATLQLSRRWSAFFCLQAHQASVNHNHITSSVVVQTKNAPSKG